MASLLSMTKSENKRLDAVRQRAKDSAAKPKPAATKATATGSSLSKTAIEKAKARKAAKKKAAPAPKKIKKDVTVRSGDTLSEIAAEFDVSVRQMMAANPGIKNANQIRVGQVLKLPKEVVTGSSVGKTKNPYQGQSSKEITSGNAKRETATQRLKRKAVTKQRKGRADA